MYQNSVYSLYKNKWIKEGVITRKVNTNHIVYKQIRNAFIQELTDAGVALNTFFQTSPTTNISQKGVINTDKKTGEFIFNPGYDNSELTASKVYDRYHVNGKHLLEKDENGIYHLTGNVFKSDRFIYTYKEDFVDSEGKTHKAGETRNFGQEILNEAFDFLYGGADNTYLHMKEIDK